MKREASGAQLHPGLGYWGAEDRVHVLGLSPVRSDLTMNYQAALLVEHHEYFHMGKATQPVSFAADDAFVGSVCTAWMFAFIMNPGSE